MHVIANLARIKMSLIQSLLKYLTPALTALALSTPAYAAPPSLLLGISEGTASTETYAEMQDKYKPLAHYLSLQLKRPVVLESSRSLESLNYNLKNKRYDLVLTRVVQIAARAMRDDGYRLVVTAKGELMTDFIVRADSPLKSPADLKGKKIALPEEQAFVTRVALAMLRDQGIQPNQVSLSYFRGQEALADGVQKKSQEAGAIGSFSKIAKNWTAQGGRVLWQSPKLPFWPVLASANVDDATINATKTALLGLSNTPEGEAILKNVGVAGFAISEPAPYLAVLKWLDK